MKDGPHILGVLFLLLEEFLLINNVTEVDLELERDAEDGEDNVGECQVRDIVVGDGLHSPGWEVCNPEDYFFDQKSSP